MEKPSGELEEILLKDLKKEYYRLQFLVDTGNQNIQKEMEVSFQAGRLVGSLYDALDRMHIVDNINAYLIEAPDIFIENRKKPISSVSNVVFGSMPNDGGILSDYSFENKEEIF